MGKIVVLDELTINQIAAGEVIERPASVVKEMLENSIDAGAKNITIEIKSGGISLIRITDDGCGISEDDMEIAFERHATSKIRSAEDLREVKTMGFRGEALASIAAIANVEMVSKTAEDTVGHKIVVEGGKVLDKSEIGTVTGTRITVQNLFFNTPVRYKFLKKDYTEAGYIEDIVTRIALINRGVAIKLINNDKVLLQTTGGLDTKNMIYSIYGKDVANGIKEVEYTYEDIKVTGVIGEPAIARSNRANQLFFVNGRFVRDKNLTAAIEQAYKGLIPDGKYAFAILNLEMNPNEVDVNVHPAKLEVRFEDEQKVFKAVYNTVKGALEGAKPYVESESFISIPKLDDKPSLDDFDKDVEDSEDNEESEATVESNQNDVEDNAVAKEDTVSSEEIEEKISISSLLKKFKRDKDEDVSEEEKENPLLEIFNSRKLTNPELSKPVEFNTKELDFDVNEALKNETIVLDSVAKIEKQETMTIPTTKEVVSEETQIIDSNEVNNEFSATQALERFGISTEDVEEKPEEIENKFESNFEKPQDGFESAFTEEVTTIENNASGENFEKYEETHAEEYKADNQVEAQEEYKLDNQEEYKADNQEEAGEYNSNNQAEAQEEKDEDVVIPSLDAVEKITSKILEMKMNRFDNTQMIDTSKVRESMVDKEGITPEFADMYRKTFGLDANEIRKERELERQEREKINVSSEFVNAENESIFENPMEKSRVNYKFVGIAFDKNIIIEYNNEMYIIDEMAARERINYEIIRNSYYSSRKDSTVLLLPDIITCTFNQMAITRENVDLFKNAGFDFEEFGENTIKLIAVPSMCESLNTKILFLNILDEIGNVAVNDIEEKEEKFIRAVAANSTIKSKLKLDEKEADSLLQELLALDEPFLSEPGRSVAVKMSRNDIEKKFARRK